MKLERLRGTDGTDNPKILKTCVVDLVVKGYEDLGETEVYCPVKRRKIRFVGGCRPACREMRCESWMRGL